MYHDTTHKHSGIGTVLVAAVAAAQVLAFSFAAMPELDGHRGHPQEAAPALLPEVVVTATRIAS